ncbi:MAG: formylglycine-generating enzyme family protein [Elusimicrobia bacterium]|nr:formylglycine-generating enzyme family protein [Elusimicrobiota bacterium]
MKGIADLLVAAALSGWPAAAGAAEFQVSPLPELPAAAAPATAGAWSRPRAELPVEAGRAESFHFENVDAAGLKEYDAVAHFEDSDAPPQEKAARWRGLGRQVQALAGACQNRAAQWEEYAAARTLDAVLEKEGSGAAPDEKRAAWLELAKSWPAYAPTALAQAREWQRYAVELAAVDEVRRQRAKLRDQDWSRLSKLLALADVDAGDKRRFAAAFVKAYGKDPEDDPHIDELLPFLPQEMLSPEDAGALAAIDWVTIAGGSFVMGATDLGPSSLPRHRVSVRTFRLARTLVTNKQYQACVQAGACAAPADRGDKFKGGGQPAVGVDWDQAQAFARWAGGRLPTEAEWEYAARGRGERLKYPWGDDEATCRLAVFDDSRWPQASRTGCGKASTWPVCSKPEGNTRQGLCDMAGDAWQWVQDRYHDTYSEAPRDGSAWEAAAGPERVIRGGAWSYGAASLRSAARGSRDAGKRASDVGFRLAQSDLPEKSPPP